LTDDEIPTRYLDDLIWCKDPGAGRTGYHQDSCVEGADRIGRVNFWVALNEITPDMGSVRYCSRSHRAGPFGWYHGDDDPDPGDERDPLFTAYPKLRDLYELSPPLHYQPGDATVHQGWTIHGGPGNDSDRPRWAYIAEYTPNDVRYRDAKYGDGERHPLLRDDGTYPVVYPPAERAA
jgi:ectoine hydroxylase-related dioxygenase (phytanoyl-CoA dioxygenase family)